MYHKLYLNLMNLIISNQLMIFIMVVVKFMYLAQKLRKMPVLRPKRILTFYRTILATTHQINPQQRETSQLHSTRLQINLIL